MRKSALRIAFLTLALCMTCLVREYGAQSGSVLVKVAPATLYTANYLSLRGGIVDRFASVAPGAFGETVEGVHSCFVPHGMQIALTFDACSGKPGSYNKALIDYLRSEHIQATLFVTYAWANANRSTVAELAADPLFDIENHGLMHRVCSVDGRSAYNITPTRNITEVVDEIGLSAGELTKMIGTRPRLFRPATAFIDEASVSIASALGQTVVGYDVLSGDAVAGTPAATLEQNILKNAHPGAIVIMHFNHPAWFEKDALQAAVPKLRSQGYTFVKLSDVLP